MSLAGLFAVDQGRITVRRKAGDERALLLPWKTYNGVGYINIGETQHD